MKDDFLAAVGKDGVTEHNVPDNDIYDGEFDLI